MFSGVILYVVVCCAEFSKGLLEYKNNCSAITIAQPAIDRNYVLLTFIPNGPVDDQTEVKWKYRSPSLFGWRETDISNSSAYILSSQHTTYMMDLYCYKNKVKERQFSATLITKTEKCASMWIAIDVLDAPTECGILYREAKKIELNDEVVLKYYAPRGILSNKRYIRQVRRKTDDCREQFGCPVNQTWFKEEYRDRNSVYLYTIRDFTPDMEGSYLIQCTNRTRDIKATNDVRLIIPVPPGTPTFLNTSDVDGCEGCIPVDSNTYTDIKCQVKGGGTLPVIVKIVIAGEEEGKCNFDKPSYMICRGTKYIASGLHLKEIRCEAINEAISDPLSTSTRLYVVEKPMGPYLYNSQQLEGEVNIYCYSWNGRPAPELTMHIDGNLINTTNVAKEYPKKHIKLTYLQRDWNGAKIQCCMHHPYLTEPKCSERTIDYLFSPASVNLTVSEPEPSGTGSFLQTLLCTIINANPACRIKWNHPDGANVTIRPKEIKPTGQGGYNTVSELQLNGTMEIDGSEINCKPICDKFETEDIATHVIRIPYPPILSINTSGQSSWRVGDTVVFACRVDSYSSVNVTWYTFQNRSLDSFDCGEGAVCLQLDRIHDQDAGTYVCKAATEYFNPAVKSVVLNIESTATDKIFSEGREKTLPWTFIGIGAAAGVVVLILVTVLLTRRRRNKERHKTANEDVPMNALNGQAIVNESRDEQNGADAYDSLIEATYANTANGGQGRDENVKIAAASSPKVEANTYETIPIPGEQHMDSRDTESDSAGNPGSSDLVYADLDLPAEGTTSRNPNIASDEPQTEYVSVDFNRVGEQLPEPSEVESENIYANQ